MSLKGKTAVVTGGAKGIGKAIALRLAEEDANIGILDILKDKAEKTVEEIKKQGVEARAIECDVIQYAKVKGAVAEIYQAYGSIDILINNAGIDDARAFVDTDEALWDKIMGVNFKGFLNASHVCVPYMIEQNSGNIVSLGSDAGRIGAANEVIYCATKAAVMAASKALAREVVRYNIRVNCVSPGPVHTDLWDQLHPGEKGQK
ncbi:MAG: SDR family NAD(P)-dependent oxidoreductase, partial [Desulfobacteraceae bacterium]